MISMDFYFDLNNFDVILKLKDINMFLRVKTVICSFFVRCRMNDKNGDRFSIISYLSVNVFFNNNSLHRNKWGAFPLLVGLK